MPDPREEYTQRLAARRAALADRERRHRALGNARVLAFVIAAGVLWAAIGQRIISAWWLLVPAILLILLGKLLDNVEQARTRLERAVAYQERSLARLEGKWAGTGETGARFVDEHHLYAQDLDLFGPGSLFELLSAARTGMGEETLAGWLLAPASAAIVQERQAAVVELAPRLDLREDLAVLGENARTGVHPEALAAWGERPAVLVSNWFRPLAAVISVLGALALAALFLYFVAPVLGLSPGLTIVLRDYFVAMAIVVGAVLARFKARTDRIVAEAEAAAHDLGLLAGVLGRLEREPFGSPLAARLRAELETASAPPSRRIARLGRLMELLDSRHNLAMRAIGPLLLWDLHLSYAVEKWRRLSGPALRRWLNAVGEMEALSSLAGYHFERPRDIFPEFSSDGPCFAGEGLGHPLLPEDRVVRNDVSIGGELRVLVVSGSNMSGKSTLLRTIGVNCVLAQAGAPVRARRLRLSALALGASIRVQDSLQGGTSRFYAEITRLRDIMQQAGGQPPVLFLIDEFLHGTNSHDRRIGAEAIVRGLVERGGIGLVTTHDLALAHIAEELGARGANVHFEDYLEDGRMRFDYRMRPGVVQKSNAIELMRSVGLQI